MGFTVLFSFEDYQTILFCNSILRTEPLWELLSKLPFGAECQKKKERKPAKGAKMTYKQIETCRFSRPPQIKWPWMRATLSNPNLHNSLNEGKLLTVGTHWACLSILISSTIVLLLLLFPYSHASFHFIQESWTVSSFQKFVIKLRTAFLWQNVVLIPGWI